MIARHRSLAALGTVATLATEGAVITALTVVGREPAFRVPLARLDEWLRVTPPADALVAGLRWVALVGAWWLLIGTLVYVAAAATRLPGAVRAVRWAALPPVRRVVDAAFVATVVGGVMLGPGPSGAGVGARAAGPPTTTLVRDGRGDDLASLPPATTTVPTTTLPPSTSPASATPAPDRAEVRVVVAPGDDLWELAARRFAAIRGLARADVADAEVAPYWVAVCDRNRPTLGSGDPNLIFPGEVVTLPAVS